ncbi:MAG: T9SS type A sorting domain-containing protein [Bacteroidales bacterium]
MDRSQFAIFIILTMTGPVTGSTLAAQDPQVRPVIIDTAAAYQTMTGFGASLAYYENWLTAHPNKNEIYDVIFSELSLDILRVRNAHGYDATMVDRVKEFAGAARQSLGRPIPILSTSWGPPDSLKSNNDRKNGGTLRYTTGEGGVLFDYAGFAGWWNSALDEYSQNGVYPTYISIQNEPDFTATWESCRLDPSETISGTDTIAGFDRALDSVYHRVMLRDNPPVFLGPECIGIGYNAVENYVNALDLSKLHGIAHHLYHGASEDDPWASASFAKVGDFHPEVPHFQTEYSRTDWFNLSGLIHQSLHAENVTAFLYWDLIWNEGGLVSLDFPWDPPSKWDDPQKGYTRTKEFFVFKQYSAFIHPGWQRVGTTLAGGDVTGVTFMSPGMDSAAFVGINLSQTDTFALHLSIPGYIIDTSGVFRTSEVMDCEPSGGLTDSVFVLPPRSIGTVAMEISRITGELEIAHAGPDQEVCGQLEVTLAGNEPVIGTGTWTQISGPGTITFGDEHAFNTTAMADTYGTYVLEWEIDTDDYVSDDQAEIRFAEAADAGPDQMIHDQLATTLAGNGPAIGTGTWTMVSGPGTVTFGNANTGTTTATADEYGTYVLEWEIVNGSCATDDQVEIRFEETTSATFREGSFVSVTNFPDPFSVTTQIRFFLRDGGRVMLSVYDCTGKEIRKLDLGARQRGTQEYTLQRGGMKSGLYFFRLDHSSGNYIHGRFIIQ